MSPIVLHFDDRDSNDYTALGHNISDDSACESDDDDEIYDKNPIEIHEKMIPY
jgi:hypothetical protein